MRRKYFRPGQAVQWSAWHAPDETILERGYVAFDPKDGTDEVLVLVPGERSYITKYRENLTALDKPAATVIRARRPDGYEHVAVIMGRRMVIKAGCRLFTTLRAALNHWEGRRRDKRAYDKQLRFYGSRGRDLGRRYDRPSVVRQRAKDKEWNKFSIAFARKAERIRAKN